MANDRNEIHFDCPKCQRPMSGVKALLGEMINCPDCGEPFMPTPRKLDPKIGTQQTPEAVAAASAMNAALLAKLDSRPGQDVASRAQKIHNRAEVFSMAAILLCVFGLFGIVASCAEGISGEGSAGGGFIVAGSFIGASLWFYLIAQVIHIRANTEK